MLLLLLSCTLEFPPCASTQVVGIVETNRDALLPDALFSHCALDDTLDCTAPVPIGRSDARGRFDVQVPGTLDGLRCSYASVLIEHPSCAPGIRVVPLTWPDESIQLDCE